MVKSISTCDSSGLRRPAGTTISAKIAKQTPQARPPLTAKLTAEVFLDCYWDRKELAAFCRDQGLSTAGLKEDVTERIAEFLKSGKRLGPAKKSVAASAGRDSDKKLTLTTPVVNYKNDAKTRDFFIVHCGPGFRFNDYLRGFAKGVPEGKKLTYGDLIEGWRKAEEKRENGEKDIGKQFEYNQFSRDFFAANPSGGRKDMMEAWAAVRGYRGPNTYDFYKSIQSSQQK